VPDTLSKQTRLAQTKDITSWLWTYWDTALTDFPAWGSAERPARLREAARSEPILSGAVSSMSSKVVSMDWQVTGGRSKVHRFQPVLAEAEDGRGWNFWLDRLIGDYLQTDLGGIGELGREDKNGPVEGIYNLDSARCHLTGNVNYPLRYAPYVAGGDEVALRPDDYMHIVDMPSSDETRFGLGMCAVSRALKAANVLLALYNYEEQRLSDMPLPGVAAVTGMTMQEVKDAFALYKAQAKDKGQTTFKSLLWLAATQSSLAQIKVDLLSFASLPDGFDKQQTVTLYVYTLALDFGVDVREFWPASQTGATKAEAEVQANKAKGKGLGRMVASIERAINWSIMPEGVEFLFDQRDSEEDLLRESIREKAFIGIRRLWEPASGTMGLLTTDEARRLLVEGGFLPAWIAQSSELSLSGMSTDMTQEVLATTPEGLTQGVPIPGGGVPTLPEIQGAVGKQLDSAILEKAAKARLAPGEDLIAMKHNGDTQTLWSSRSYFYPVSNWPSRRPPLDKPEQEVPAANPFGRRTLTRK